MTTLLLARHGETDWNRDGRFQGHADPSLNALGREQAAALARRLHGEPVSAVYASDLARAQETAEIVAGGLALEVVPVPELREADVGELTGLTRAEIAERFPDAAALAERHGYTFAAGEGYESVAARVLSALDDIAESHEDETVLVVSHGGPIRVVLAHVDGLDIDVHRQQIAPAANGDLFRLAVTGGVLRRLD